MANIDWIKIKNEYVNTSTSYRKLAEKHKVNKDTIAKRAQAENWANLKDKQIDKIQTCVIQQTADIIVKKEINAIERISNASILLLDKLEEASKQLENYIVTNKVKVKTVKYDKKNKGKPTKEITTENETIAIVDGIIDKQGLKYLASTLKDLKEIQTALQSVAKPDELTIDPLTESLQELAKELSND